MIPKAMVASERSFIRIPPSSCAAACVPARAWCPARAGHHVQHNSEIPLTMEAGDEKGFAEHVAVHGVNHRRTRIRRFLRSALRNIKLGVQRVQLEGVVM